MREGERIRMRGERDWCRKRFVKSITTMLMRGERERGTSVTGVIEWGRYRYTEREKWEEGWETEIQETFDIPYNFVVESISFRNLAWSLMWYVITEMFGIVVKEL